MSQLPSPQGDRRPTVLPLFGGGGQVPSPVLVRGAVGRVAEGVAERVRSAEAVASALGEVVREAARGERRPRWGEPVAAPEGELMRRTGLLHSEVRDAIDLLVASRTALREGDLLRIDPGVVGELPCLARVDWERVRSALGEAGASLAPSLGVLRELARQAEPDDGGGSGWVEGSLPGLAESVGYGRTVVSQALSALAACGFLERAAGRRLRVRLLPRVLGEAEAREPAREAGTGALAPAAPAAEAGASFGSHPIHLPPGTPIELHLLEGGGSRLQMGPLSVETQPDGSQTLVYGALRIRP